MLSFPVIKLESLANTGAMSVAQMGARLLLSVTLTQLAITTPLVMAQAADAPTSPPPGLSLSGLSTSWATAHLRVIVGIAVAVICVKILVVLAVLWYCLRKKRERSRPPNIEGLALPRTQPDARRFSYAEVEAISNNWSRKLGEGGFGTVYYGETVSDQSPNAEPRKVALKKLSATSQQGKNEFLNEVLLLSRIHFKYLVPFEGFCDENNHQVLVYEYMQEGSLADWLHGAKRGRPDFNWYNRLVIALHAALGLHYFHEGATPNIIHRDVKSSNILITRNWEGRVADFGLSKTNGISDQDQPRTHMTTAVKGTLGYLDPEYHRTGKLTFKSDVYSFGIVLLELVTGRLPIDSSKDDPQLEKYVQGHIPHNLATIVDPNLKGNYDMRSMQKIAQVALRSVALHGIDRPTMSDVVVEIRSAMELMEPGGEGPATTNTQDSLVEPATGSATRPAIQTPHAIAPGQHTSRPGSSQQSTGPSSVTSVPSTVALLAKD